MNEQAVVLIFKVPEKGKIKTRLAAQIGEERTFWYYKKMLYDTLENLKKLQQTHIFGFYKGNINLLTVNIPLFEQKGKELGETIYNAFNKIKCIGYKKIAIIGSDSPDLPIHYIQRAFENLEKTDFVIGPAEDGGFYLLLAKELSLHIFKDIVWGSSNVLKVLLQNIVGAGKHYFLLNQWYDIDTKSDLERWLKGKTQFLAFL